MCPGAVRTLHRPSADVNVRMASVRLKTILIRPRNASEVDGRECARGTFDASGWPCINRRRSCMSVPYGPVCLPL
jgi:hypothetical protein